MKYTGTIIEESLEDKSVLKDVKILSTRVEPIKESHQTPWLSQWTLHKVEILKEQAKKIAEELSQALDREHGGSWYADYKNDETHYIIFPDKIFKINRTIAEQYKAVTEYGLRLDIPDYQVDFKRSVVKNKS